MEGLMRFSGKEHETDRDIYTRYGGEGRNSGLWKVWKTLQQPGLGRGLRQS